MRDEPSARPVFSSTPEPPQAPVKEETGVIPMEVASIEAVDEDDAVIRLRARERPAVLLPVWVGAREAALVSIASAGLRSSRPITHDVLQQLLHAFGLVLVRAVISGLHDGVFHAHLVVAADGDERTIDCRPADAIALALRESAPLLVEDALLADRSLSR